jgi:hypothetical protein
VLRFLLGVALIGAGIVFVFISLNPPEPKCGDRVMKPGDVCIVGTKAVTYDERKGGTNTKELGIGVGLGVIGVLLLVSGAVGRQRKGSAAQPTTE